MGGLVKSDGVLGEEVAVDTGVTHADAEIVERVFRGGGVDLQAAVSAGEEVLPRRLADGCPPRLDDGHQPARTGPFRRVMPITDGGRAGA